MTKSIWIGISGQQWDQNKENYTWNTKIPIHQNKHSKLDGKVTVHSRKIVSELGSAYISI